MTNLFHVLNFNIIVDKTSHCEVTRPVNMGRSNLEINYIKKICSEHEGHTYITYDHENRRRAVLDKIRDPSASMTDFEPRQHVTEAKKIIGSTPPHPTPADGLACGQ